MTVNLNLADLAFLLAQVNEGANPPPGSDPLSLLGIRTIDGTNNNLTHATITDQHGNLVDTDTFANVDQPFFHIVPTSSPNIYTPNTSPVDSSPRIISNLIADITTDNPAVPADAIGNSGAPAFFIPPSSALFTFFGQFFDHGLDFINKGGNGTVVIPLPPGDPLSGLSPAGDFMFVTRATLDGNGDTINSTAPMIEQSQTYGQLETTTFYLKEYDMAGELTGRLVTHADGTMATWADIKANALLAPGGPIILEDRHVLDIPDPSAWGSADVTLFDPAANGGMGGFLAAAGTGQSFLADIAHNANPGGLAAGNPDADMVAGNVIPTNMMGQNLEYDDELLDLHKIAGDPRANENIVLTSIHQAFHGEHNRLVLVIEDLIAQQDQVTPGFALQWDGERIFQAAKLVNEMQYQHFAFEEFGRRLSPNIDAFAQYDVTINPNISAEFSQAVYRLGHSMLTDTVRSVNDVDQTADLTLIQSFLNPIGYDAVGPASLIEGQNRQQMNTIDEFVVDAVRNFLVGLPLDLAAINIARGRDVGLGTLNQTRAELFAQTGESTLAAYVSWADFGANLLNPDSLVNFIAAYARATQTDGGADAAGVAIEAARNAGDNTLARTLAAAAILDPVFMGTGALSNPGFNDIDLWMGGLAESKVIGPGGVPGLLGSTFDFVFAMQMRALQDGDRLYYLARLGGTNILDEIEAATIGDLFERGTGARHTMGDIFSAPDENIEISALVGNDFTSPMGDWREVIGGTTVANVVNAGDGNDTVWGEAGDDVISGDGGNDHLYGQAGDDTISGGAGDDFIRGDAGNDIITGDGGADHIFGGTGNDTVSAGTGADEVFGGRGNDTIHGGDQDDFLFGNENDDMVFGDGGDDAIEGGTGDDFLDGGLGDDTLLGYPGNDVLVGGPGADVLNGGLGGHDLAFYQESAPGSLTGIVIDMTGAASNGNALGDTFIDIEEVRATPFDDGIIGDDFDNILSGGLGDDTLEGGLGNDVLYAGPGNDTLRGDGGIDQAVYFGTHIATGVTGGVVAIPGDIGGVAPMVFTIDIGGDTQMFDISDGALDTLGALEAAINGVFAGNPATIVGGNQLQLLPGPVSTDDITIADVDPGAAALAGLTPGVTLGADFALDTTLIGGGTVDARNGEVNTHESIEEVAFDDGIFNTSVEIYVPLLTLNNSHTLTVNGVDLAGMPLAIELDGNVVNDIAVLDGTTVGVNGIFLADIGIIDPDGTEGIVNVTLAGADAAMFQIFNAGPTGRELRFVGTQPGSMVNFEVQERFEVTVNAADDTGGSALNYQLNITDVNDNAPLFTSPDHVFVQDGTSTTAVVYRATSTDIDTVGAPVVYTMGIGAADSALFTLSNNGEITFNTAPDFGAPIDAGMNNVYEIDIDAFDGVNTTKKFATITVTAEGAPVFNMTPVVPFLVNENTPASTVIYDAGAAAVMPVVFSLGGADAALFTIDAVSGELRFAASPDFETPLDVGMDNLYDVQINATAGVVASSQDVSVQVLNLGGVTITGTPGADVITSTTTVAGQPLATPENDLIYGLGGNDVLAGGDGNDALSGGPGADFLGGGAGMDSAVYWTAGGPVTASLADPSQNTGEAAGDSYDSIENLHGSFFSDFLYGDEFANRILGWGGNDVLQGGAGADLLNGGAHMDSAVYWNASVGLTASLADASLNTGDAAGDTYISIENLQGSNHADTLFGDGLANRVFGWAGNDVINGGGGSDLLTGGTGNDTFVTMVGGGADVITDFEGGPGVGDVVDVTAFGALNAGNIFASITDMGGNAVLDLGGGDTVTFQGDLEASLDVDDFLFA